GTLFFGNSDESSFGAGWGGMVTDTFCEIDCASSVDTFCFIGTIGRKDRSFGPPITWIGRMEIKTSRRMRMNRNPIPEDKLEINKS
ncbi:MAG: hypothetical protein ABF384_03245, partial [Verrucomicrobiales bacterium]